MQNSTRITNNSKIIARVFSDFDKKDKKLLNVQKNWASLCSSIASDPLTTTTQLR